MYILLVGAGGFIGRHLVQRLAQRGAAVRVVTRIVDRRGHRLAERDADVLNRVMRIDVQITLRLDVEIDQAMARDLIEHMLEKGQTRMQIGLAGPIEVDRYRDLGLEGIAFDTGASAHRWLRVVARYRY